MKRASAKRRLALPEDFDELYDKEIVERLSPLGFERRSRTAKAIDLIDGTAMVSLLRMPFKGAAQGYAYFSLCFRHTFLRADSFKGPQVVEKIAGLSACDYPYHFQPKKLLEGQPLKIGTLNAPYRRAEIEDYPYACRTPDEIHMYLRSMATLIETQFVPWARSLTPKEALAEIEAVEAEKKDSVLSAPFWIAEYRRHLRRR